MRKPTIESFIKETQKRVTDGKIRQSGVLTRLINSLSAYIKYYPDHISYLEDLNEEAFLRIRGLSAGSWFLFQQLIGKNPIPLTEFTGTYGPLYRELERFEKIHGWKTTFYAMLQYQRKFHPDPEGESYSFNNPSCMK